MGCFCSKSTPEDASAPSIRVSSLSTPPSSVRPSVRSSVPSDASIRVNCGTPLGGSSVYSPTPSTRRRPVFGDHGNPRPLGSALSSSGTPDPTVKQVCRRTRANLMYVFGSSQNSDDLDKLEREHATPVGESLMAARRVMRK